MHGRFAMFSPRNVHLPHLPHLPHPHFSASHFHMPNLRGTAEEGTKATGLHFIGQFLRARSTILHRVMAKERARAEKASEAHMVAEFEEEQASSVENKPPGSPLRRFSSTSSPPLPPLWGELSEDMASLPPPAASHPPSPESSKPKVGAAAEAYSNDSEKINASPSGRPSSCERAISGVASAPYSSASSPSSCRWGGAPRIGAPTSIARSSRATACTSPRPSTPSPPTSHSFSAACRARRSRRIQPTPCLTSRWSSHAPP